MKFVAILAILLNYSSAANMNKRKYENSSRVWIPDDLSDRDLSGRSFDYSNLWFSDSPWKKILEELFTEKFSVSHDVLDDLFDAAFPAKINTARWVTHKVIYKGSHIRM